MVEVFVGRVERVVDFEVFCTGIDCAVDVDIAVKIAGIPATGVSVYSITRRASSSSAEVAAYAIAHNAMSAGALYSIATVTG